ncbi:hypothetical protein D3C81_1211530 [compost metagenome]
MFAVLQQVVETEQAAAQGVIQNPVIIIETQLKFGSNLVIFSVTAGFCFNCPNRVTDHAGIAVNRTWCPVPFAYFVKHCPADPDTGVGLETGTLARVVLVGNFEQADHAGLDQVFHLHTGRQTRQQVIGDTFDQRRIALDQLVLTIARSLAVHPITAGVHSTGPALVGCTRRSTKNSR